MNALILLMEINPQISAFNAKSISNGFFIYSLSYLNINFFIIFLFFFNISLFFLYLFLTAIFFKFPTTIFFKFHNIIKFCSRKRTRGENIYIYIYINKKNIIANVQRPIKLDELLFTSKK